MASLDVNGLLTEKTFAVHLTDPEMAAIASAVTGFFNVMSREKKTVTEKQAALLVQALLKMKEAAGGPAIVLVQ